MNMRNPGLCRRWTALLLVLWLAVPLCAQASELHDPHVTYCVDFEYLKQIAPGAAAWLYSPDGTFNTPVMYSPDEKHYLRHRFDEAWDNNGSLFFTGDAAPDFTQPILTMHGNFCAGDELFGSLYNYRRADGYYQQHPTLYLLTPEGNYRLDVFAGLRTAHSDHDSWRISDSAFLLTETLPQVLAASFLTPLAEALPQEGDQWMILTTEDRRDQGNRYVIYTRMRPVTLAEDAPVMNVNQMALDNRATLNGFYTVEGVGTWMVYGQNDPSWDPLIFETENSSRKRHFGDGGCGPTAVAAAIANLSSPEELLKINYYAPQPYGYTICTCSLTQPFCYDNHVPYCINTPEEMLRYFPLVVGNFATGNNTLGVQGRYDRYGTNMNYLETLCKAVYGLQVNRTEDKVVAFDFLQQGKGTAVTCTGKTTIFSPFTNTSHFITLVGADDTYVYIIDPLRRSDYGDLDPDGDVEILTPGLVRLTRQKAMYMMMSPIYLLSVEE